MTDTANILKAKIDAVATVANALETRIADGDISSVDGVGHFLATWLEAMRTLVPEASGEIQYPLWPDSPEPPIGTVLEDKSFDLWTRTSNGLWICTGEDGGAGTDAEGTSGWVDVTHYAPLRKPTN